jgi:hypothetical protein
VTDVERARSELPRTGHEQTRHLHHATSFNALSEFNIIRRVVEFLSIVLNKSNNHASSHDNGMFLRQDVPRNFRKITHLGGFCFGTTGRSIAQRSHARKGDPMIGAGGLVVSIIVFAVGAILDWAVTASPYQHGFNVNKVGWILMIVGVVGAVLSIIVMVLGTTRRQRTVVDDGQGNVVRRVDSTY